MGQKESWQQRSQNSANQYQPAKRPQPLPKLSKADQGQQISRVQKRHNQVKQKLHQLKQDVSRSLQATPDQAQQWRQLFHRARKPQSLNPRRKQPYRMIDIDQLDRHDNQYSERKRYENQLRRIRFDPMGLAVLQQPQYYRGRYRSIVLEDMARQREKEAEDPKLLRKLKVLRQLNYAQKVKEEYMPPPVRSQPKSEGVEQDGRVRLAGRPRYRDSTTGDEDYDSSVNQKIHGLRNLSMVRQHVRACRAKGLIKSAKPQTPQPVARINYLQDFKNQREQLPPRKQIMKKISKANLRKVGDFESIKFEAGKFDERARQQQKFIRNNRDMSMWESLELRKRADQQNLAAIRAKISMLKVDQFDER